MKVTAVWIIPHHSHNILEWRRIWLLNAEELIPSDKRNVYKHVADSPTPHHYVSHCTLLLYRASKMAEGTPTINLKVLSPSTEVEGGVNLADVPTTTTIKELRSRIQDAVPSKPATERMRLIYRGRVVANDADTLADVFGADNVRNMFPMASIT
jgi:hypothetical protein